MFSFYFENIIEIFEKWIFNFTLLPPFLSVGSCASVCSAALLSKSSKQKDYPTDFLSQRSRSRKIPRNWHKTRLHLYFHYIQVRFFFQFSKYDARKNLWKRDVSTKCFQTFLSYCHFPEKNIENCFTNSTLNFSQFLKFEVNRKS